MPAEFQFKIITYRAGTKLVKGAKRFLSMWPIRGSIIRRQLRADRGIWDGVRQPRAVHRSRHGIERHILHFENHQARCCTGHAQKIHLTHMCRVCCNPCDQVRSYNSRRGRLIDQSDEVIIINCLSGVSSQQTLIFIQTCLGSAANRLLILWYLI